MRSKAFNFDFIQNPTLLWVYIVNLLKAWWYSGLKIVIFPKAHQGFENYFAILPLIFYIIFTIIIA